jgi:hypothetical protein
MSALMNKYHFTAGHSLFTLQIKTSYLNKDFNVY